MDCGAIVALLPSTRYRPSTNMNTNIRMDRGRVTRFIGAGRARLTAHHPYPLPIPRPKSLYNTTTIHPIPQSAISEALTMTPAHRKELAAALVGAFPHRAD